MIKIIDLIRKENDILKLKLTFVKINLSIIMNRFIVRRKKITLLTHIDEMALLKIVP